MAHPPRLSATAAALSAVLLLCSGSVAAFDIRRGFVLGSGEWSSGMSLSSEGVGPALDAIKASGGSWVRLIPSAYFKGSIYPEENTMLFLKPNGTFRSDTPEDVSHATALAHSKGLKVLLSPVIDPDFSTPGNWERRCSCHSNSTWRGSIGGNPAFSEKQWAEFFASYRAWLGSYLEDKDNAPDMLSVGAELLTPSTTREDDWRSLIKWVRTKYSGPLTYAAIKDAVLDHRIKWLDALDFIGVDMYVPLDTSPAIPKGQQDFWPDNLTVPSVGQFVEAWQPYLAQLKNISETVGVPVVFCEVGYQSKWGAWRHPSGVLTLDPTDGSAWERSVSLETQANLYDALLTALEPHAGTWWGGVFWWILRVDQTAGGTCDDSFVPLGKPAMAVVAKHWGGGASYVAPRAARAPAETAMPETAASASSAASLASSASPGASSAARALLSKNASKINGVVYGGGVWSSPNYRLGSPGALQSLKDLRATGASWVRLITTWFGDSPSALSIYPANGSSHLKSDTDEEIEAFVGQARGLGLRVHLAPYIDPNWDIPSNCRGPSCGKIPGTPGKAGRGEFGSGFDDAQWDAWFNADGSYGAYIMHMAGLANKTGCSMFSVGSELATMFSKRPDDVGALTRRVRGVFHGHVTAAINWGQAVKSNLSFWQELDSVGVEGYEKLGISAGVWETPTVADLVSAWHSQLIPQLERVHNVSGKDIQFTEVGYQSRPGSWQGPASTNASDPIDCSVTALCAAPLVQAAEYDALMSAMYPKDWFLGAQFWLWRADPTAGGLTDYSFTPQNKPATLAVMSKWYKWYA